MDTIFTTYYPEYSTINGSNLTGDSSIFHKEMVKGNMLSVPLGLSTLYVSVSQMAYLVMKICQEGRRGAAGGPSRKIGSVSGRAPHFMTFLCIFASFTSFLRSGIDLRLVYGYHDNFGCDLSIKFKVVTASISMLAFYLVLWMRQKIFYQDRRLKQLSSCFITAFIWMVLTLLVSGNIIGIGLFTNNYYEARSVGCRTIPGKLNKIRWYFLVTVTVVYQICILSLFVYPLVKHRQKMRRMRSVRISYTAEIRLITLIKRTAVIATIGISTDILSAIIMLSVKSSGSFSNRLYDINNVINVVSVVFVFGDWRDRLMPWRLKRRQTSRMRYIANIQTVQYVVANKERKKKNSQQSL